MFRFTRRLAVGIAALAALALGAATVAGAAASSTSSTTATTGGNTHRPPAFHGPAPGTPAHEDAEKAVTGAAATKAEAAAVKSVGSGTAGPVTTDYAGRGYETTVTKPDGTTVEVHLDSSFNVMGSPPAPPGGGSGAPHGGAGYGGPPPSGASSA
jgi:hypothetical protein